MSDSAPVPRAKGRQASPEPLRLTGREAETLNAAVQRIIRASEVSGPAGQQAEKKKSSRR